MFIIFRMVFRGWKFSGITKEHCETTIESLIEGMKHWTGGSQAAKRKVSLFDARSISIALDRLNQVVRQGA